MTPVEFPEMNEKLAKNQPQYKPLPVRIEFTHEPIPCEHCNGSGVAASEAGTPEICADCGGSGYQPVWRDQTFKYGFDDFEIEQIIRTRGCYFTQSGYGFNPVLPQVQNPWQQLPIQYEQTAFKTYIAHVPLASGGTREINGKNIPDLIDGILSTFLELKVENLLFIPKQTTAIDENGNIVQI